MSFLEKVFYLSFRFNFVGETSSEICLQKLEKSGKKMIRQPNKVQRAGDFKPTAVKSVFLKHRQDTLNLNGWGFKDSIFAFQKGQLTFTGNR